MLLKSGVRRPSAAEGLWPGLQCGAVLAGPLWPRAYCQACNAGDCDAGSWQRPGMTDVDEENTAQKRK
jgi:hypothetical protein